MKPLGLMQPWKLLCTGQECLEFSVHRHIVVVGTSPQWCQTVFHASHYHLFHVMIIASWIPKYSERYRSSIPNCSPTWKHPQGDFSVAGNTPWGTISPPKTSPLGSYKLSKHPPTLEISLANIPNRPPGTSPPPPPKKNNNKPTKKKKKTNQQQKTLSYSKFQQHLNDQPVLVADLNRYLMGFHWHTHKPPTLQP